MLYRHPHTSLIGLLKSLQFLCPHFVKTEVKMVIILKNLRTNTQKVHTNKVPGLEEQLSRS